MNFKDLKFINGKCQLDYNYYVLGFTKVINKNVYECSVFNRAKLPVDLPSVKIEKVQNNKWVKIKFTESDIDNMLKKFWAITGIETPKQLEEKHFYKDFF